MPEKEVCRTEHCVYERVEGFEHCHQCLQKMEQDLIKRMKQKEEK